TYFPPEPRHGLPSWRMVLLGVSEAWEQRREEIRRQGLDIVKTLGSTARIEPSAEPIQASLFDAALGSLEHSYDRVNGGFGGAPKFPPASVIELLLARSRGPGGSCARAMALGTLEAMARGGINDQVGGGFSRYTVDATWTVPHFEKMLYDNALLARAYLHGWQVSGEERFALVCRETLDWALREMRGPEGGFCAALDADSEGVEGKFYVWSLAELREVLGELADEAIAYFGASERGNFEGANVLEGRRPRPERLDEIRRRLYEARAQRVRPGLDDKRLTAWNALMISALAEAGATLEVSAYIEAAVQCAEFVLSELRDADGRLLRTWKNGRGRLSAYLEDHAFMLEALLTLYEATFDPRWYREAVELAETIIARFSDGERGGFFSTPEDHQELPARRKDLEDTPIPSGGSAAAFGLLRLALLSGEGEYERHALGVLRLLHTIAGRHPQAFGHLLTAIDFYLAEVREVAIVGPEPLTSELTRMIRSAHRPHLVLAGGPGHEHEPAVPLLKDREPIDGQTAAYVCEHLTCQAPVTTPAELANLLDA
ncbi:MAG: thioredoxin domain-containing protein, partial [Solirubrobacteraceae bacterium]